MTTYHCQDCGCEVGHKGTKRCHSCAGKARIERERKHQQQLTADPDYVPGRPWWEIWESNSDRKKREMKTCETCGKPIYRYSQHCRTCSGKHRMARENAEVARQSEETGEPMSRRNWWEIWEQSETEYKKRPFDPKLCRVCHKRVHRDSKTLICTQCKNKQNARRKKLRPVARELVQRIFVHHEPLVLSFRGVK